MRSACGAGLGSTLASSCCSSDARLSSSGVRRAAMRRSAHSSFSASGDNTVPLPRTFNTSSAPNWALKSRSSPQACRYE
jgi:hypothetical protein